MYAHITYVSFSHWRVISNLLAHLGICGNQLKSEAEKPVNGDLGWFLKLSPKKVVWSRKFCYIKWYGLFGQGFNLNLGATWHDRSATELLVQNMWMAIWCHWAYRSQRMSKKKIEILSYSFCTCLLQFNMFCFDLLFTFYTTWNPARPVRPPLADVWLGSPGKPVGYDSPLWTWDTCIIALRVQYRLLYTVCIQDRILYSDVLRRLSIWSSWVQIHCLFSSTMAPSTRSLMISMLQVQAPKVGWYLFHMSFQRFLVLIQLINWILLGTWKVLIAIVRYLHPNVTVWLKHFEIMWGIYRVSWGLASFMERSSVLWSGLQPARGFRWEGECLTKVVLHLQMVFIEITWFEHGTYEI